MEVTNALFIYNKFKAEYAIQSNVICNLSSSCFGDVFDVFVHFSPGHNNDIGSSYTMQSQNTDLNVAIQLDGNSFAFHTTQQAQPSGTQNTLTLCPPQLNTPSLHSVATPNLSIRGYEDITEDDIRIQSHEILENEDMQDMLRMFSMGGHGSSSFNITDNNFTFTPYTPFNLDFQEDRRRSSGKAVVGWLKLKAALRWGIFIRKKAAERRAQIVELF